MKKQLKAYVTAALLALVVTAPIKLATSLAMPASAEAGVISSVKSAAKKVGGAAKSTGKAVVAISKAVGSKGKQVGVGVGSTVKRAAVATGKAVASYPPVRGLSEGARDYARRVKTRCANT